MCMVLNETKHLKKHLKVAYAQEMTQARKVAKNKEIIINDVIVFIVATDIANDRDLQTIDECR